MRSSRLLRFGLLVTFLSAGALTAAPQIPAVPSSLAVADGNEEADSDLPPRLRGTIDKSTYLRLRDEYIGRLRGIEPGFPLDLSLRGAAVRQMEQQLSRRDLAAPNAPSSPSVSGSDFPLFTSARLDCASTMRRVTNATG